MRKINPDKKGIMVNCVQCPKCNDIIYSRAHHDFRWCSCGAVGVDGGFDYFKFCFHSEKPKTLKKRINASRRELYNDWNFQTNKLGVIKNDIQKTI